MATPPEYPDWYKKLDATDQQEAHTFIVNQEKAAAQEVTDLKAAAAEKIAALEVQLQGKPKSADRIRFLYPDYDPADPKTLSLILDNLLVSHYTKKSETSPPDTARSKSLNFRSYEHDQKKTSETWSDWIFRFEAAANQHHLSDQEKKEAMVACMKNRASTLTLHIDYGMNPQTGQPYSFSDIKKAYASRFITPGESALSRADFAIAKQRETEGEIDFHSRLRYLFSRAYPDREPETNTDLITRFIQGLKNKLFAHYVQDGLPNSYAVALERCLNKKATFELIPMTGYSGHPEPMEIGAMRHSRRAVEDDDEDPSEIAAFQKRPERKKTTTKAVPPKQAAKGAKPKRKFKCHWCREIGHIQRQCPKYIHSHLLYLKSRGIAVPETDYQRNQMDISAMDAGNFNPDIQTPYDSEELNEHLHYLADPRDSSDEESF